MTIRLADRAIRVVLLDIEGTTTPIAFVHDVLFPYARARIRTSVGGLRGSAAGTELTSELEAEHATDRARGEVLPPWRADTPDERETSLVTYLLWLMDRDRKSPALKRLQGLIWDRGYQSGELHGEVYPDVPPAFRRWRGAGLDLAIYSSGSELAQRRLFGSTADGDLTPLIAGFFDTRVGAKQDPASYTGIAAALGRPAESILFISDVVGELRAAGRAGCATVLSVRPGNLPQAAGSEFERIHSFDEIA